MLGGKAGEIVSRRKTLSQCGRVGSPAEAEGKKLQFSNSICSITIILLMIRYWLLSRLFLPPFLV